MDEPHLLASPHPAADASSSARKHPIPNDERLATSDPGPSFAKRPRVAAEPPAPCGGPAPRGPEAEVQALVSMAGGIYPLARAEALRGLAAFLEKAGAGGGAGRWVVECSYGCAVELMRDEDEAVRLAVVRLICLCAQEFSASADADAGEDDDRMDLIFLQLSSMARDMCTQVRTEAFRALGKMQQVSEAALLQSLSKKVIRTDTMSGSIIKGQKLPPKLKIPCAAGIFAHGIEDEFYQVRSAACKSLGALAKFSTLYAEKALDLLMDMMNDDTEGVRLQTLQALFDMASYGYLSVQEKHMHMFLGLLVDSNALIRDAARRILGVVNLPKLQMFKSAADGLITSLEKYREEQDIYGVLFSIGKNHGSFSANIAKHLAKEISVASDGELILDKPRIKALLIVSISASFSDDKHKLDIPSVIFSHAISLLGKVSYALGEEVNQDSLLSYLCHKGGMPFGENRAMSTEFGESYGCKAGTADIDVHAKNTAKGTKCLDKVLVTQTMNSILQTVEGAWTMRMSCNIFETRSILRTCKEELRVLIENTSGSIGAFLSFLCEYIDAIRFILELWQVIQVDNSYTFGLTSPDILLEKLDIPVKRMEFCYAGLNRELEVQVLELSLLANLFRLSKIGVCSKVVLGKSVQVINRLEGLCADGSCELSEFSREIKKAFDSNPIGDTLVSNIHTLLGLFRLKPTTDFGMLKEISAVLQVCGNDSENPVSYVCGLPVGVSFNVCLRNISSHHRLWLRMTIGQSVQHTYLELSCFGGDEEVKSCSMVVPLCSTPMASSFVLRVCLVMECPYGGIITHQRGHGGPSDCVVQLCDELDVYFVSTGQG